VQVKRAQPVSVDAMLMKAGGICMTVFDCAGEASAASECRRHADEGWRGGSGVGGQIQSHPSGERQGLHSENPAQ
jgi:hypothetical protein